MSSFRASYLYMLINCIVIDYRYWCTTVDEGERVFFGLVLVVGMVIISAPLVWMLVDTSGGARIILHSSELKDWLLLQLHVERSLLDCSELEREWQWERLV